MIKTTATAFAIIAFAATFCFSSVRDGHVLYANPSVKAAGMRGAFSANTTDDAFGTFVNPAYSPSGPMAGAMFSTAFKDGYNLSEYAYGALSFIYTDLFFGINAGIGALSSVEANFGQDQECAANINLSRKFGFLGIGANIKYVGSQFYRNTDSAQFTGDAGILADFGIFSLGVAGYNLVGDFYDSNGERIRPYASAGASFNLKLFRDIGVIISAEGYQPDIEKCYFSPRAGIQLSYLYFALRAGYEYDERAEKKDKFSAGAGIDFKNIQLEYAYVPDEASKVDQHRASLSYRFKQFRVKDKQFNRQIAREKKQAKADSLLAKVKSKYDVQPRQEVKKQLVAEKSEILPLQAVSYNKDEYEFTAILCPVDASTMPDSDATTYYASTPKGDDFDAAKYLLALGNSKSSANLSAASAEAKQGVYPPTPAEDNDYDPAKELLKSSLTSKLPQSKESVNVDMKSKNTALSKKADRKSKKSSSVNDDFDAAKYILDNPGASKAEIKQTYE
ncbi:MAG: hypothetical protein FWC57_00160, partial [Endomicrobia bacterium]|nr:hypothetical protein [Endomicrobiia bacterium]